ncbi:hypothetical protein CFC21_061974, partial [Triticum aestivum]
WQAPMIRRTSRRPLGPFLIGTIKWKMVEESAEFESEAENFATLGQQIRKSLETKRWWWPS